MEIIKKSKAEESLDYICEHCDKELCNAFNHCEHYHRLYSLIDSYDEVSMIAMQQDKQIEKLWFKLDSAYDKIGRLEEQNRKRW